MKRVIYALALICFLSSGKWSFCSEQKINDNSSIIEYTIPVEVGEKFQEFSSSFSYDPYENPYYVMKIMGEKLCEILPEELVGMLREMSKNKGPSILLIKGMPIDRIIPSNDSVLERSKKKGKVSENAMLGIAYIMEHKFYSNIKQQQGRIIHNVAPVKEYEHTSSSLGREPFLLHIENPYERVPPYFLMLLCLEEDQKAETTYFFINDFLKTFPISIIENMKQPEFRIFSGTAYSRVEERIVPLISEEKELEITRLRLCEDHKSSIEPLSVRAKETLHYIEKAFSNYKKSMASVKLKKGECLIFNNGWWINGAREKGVMHGRKGYIENPYRWIQRGYLYPQTLAEKLQIREHKKPGCVILPKRSQRIYDRDRKRFRHI